MFLTKTSTVFVCLFGVYLLSSSSPPQVEAQSTGELLVQALKYSFAELSAVLKETGKILQDALEEISAAELNVTGLIKIIQVTTQLVVKLPQQALKIIPVIVKLIDSIDAIITDNLPEALAGIVGDGTPSNSSLGQGLSSITGLVGQLLDSLNQLSNSGTAAASLASRAVLSLVNVLLNSFGSLVDATLKSAGNLIADGNESVVEPLIQLLNSVIGSSLASVVNQIKALSSNSSVLLDTVGTILNLTLSQVNSLIAQLTDGSSAALRTALNGLAGTLVSLIDGLSNQNTTQ